MQVKIKMLYTVRPDCESFRKYPAETILKAGQIYEATANKQGAVCGFCTNGVLLGVKPAEFEFVSLPRWLYNIWKPVYPQSVDNAMVEEAGC